MICVLALLQSSESCVDALEKDGHPFVLDLVDSSYYIQSDLKKETTAWHQAITMATRVRKEKGVGLQITDYYLYPCSMVQW